MTRERAAELLSSVVVLDDPEMAEAHRVAISALRAQQEQESNDRLQRGMNRLGRFGKLFVEYKGCPRGAIGRACAPLEDEVFAMPEITDVDGGRWVPVNADALRELVNQYKRMMTREERNDPLTIEELRQMDGEPVWIVTGDVSWWDIVSFSVQDWLYLAKGEELRYSRYGEWLAYRRKLEEVQK